MKKRVMTFFVAVVLLVSLLPLYASAVTASAWMSGPSTVRAGDTITVSFVLSGTNLFGASGSLSYDGSQLTLVGVSQSIGGGWVVEFNGNNFAAYDNNLNAPIKGSSTIFTATFKVNNVEAGTGISVSCQNVKATDGNADANIGTVTYSATIAAPLSGDNALQSLTVGNATISPAFSPDVTSYSAQVPFSVSQLEISAAANHGSASVSINNPNLAANATTNVYVTVTAENGSTRTYTISVHRAQDPNYVPSDNSKLSGIAVEGFLLSPVFSQDITEYLVWLPYEVESVTISGTAEHHLARVKVEGGNDLVAGADNEVKVIGVAENGSQTVYTVIVKRAPAHGAEETEPVTEPTEVTEPVTEPTETTEPVTEPPETTEEPTTEPVEATKPVEPVDDGKNGEISALSIVLILLALAVGMGCGVVADRLLLKKGKGRGRSGKTG